MAIVEISIVCFTVLSISGGALWLIHKVFTMDHIKKFEQLATEFATDVEQFKKDIKADINTLAQNQQKLVDNQKNLNAAVTMATPSRGSLLQQVSGLAEKARQNKP